MKKLKFLTFVTLLPISILAVIIFTITQVTASEATAENSLKVGVVNFNLLAQSYAKAEEFYGKAGELQQEMQKLMADDDFEAAIALEEEMEVLQDWITGSFEQDVQEVANRLLEEQGLAIITTEVVAKAGHAEIIDLTPYFLATDLFNMMEVPGGGHHSCGHDCDHDHAAPQPACGHAPGECDH